MPNQYEDKDTHAEIMRITGGKLYGHQNTALMQLISQKQLEAQKLQVGGFKSDLLKMKQGYFDVDYLIDACDFELAELTKQEGNS